MTNPQATPSLDPVYSYRAQWLRKSLQDLTKDRQHLAVPELTSIDQYHYLYSDAVDEAALKLGVSNRSEILDIGSGVGGTARYLAWKYGCNVTAVELLPTLHDLAVELTHLTGLDSQIRCLQGNFLDLQSLPLVESSFDHWISFNVFMHISDRKTLFSNCAMILKPGGCFYIEDYFQRQSLKPEERSVLEESGVWVDLPNRDRYVEDLANAGFVDIVFEDVSHIWIPWLNDRRSKFDAQRDVQVAQHGAEVVDSFSQCCHDMFQLFSNGNLGGARISGRLSSGSQS